MAPGHVTHASLYLCFVRCQVQTWLARLALSPCSLQDKHPSPEPVHSEHLQRLEVTPLPCRRNQNSPAPMVHVPRTSTVRFVEAVRSAAQEGTRETGAVEFSRLEHSQVPYPLIASGGEAISCALGPVGKHLARGSRLSTGASQQGHAKVHHRVNGMPLALQSFALRQDEAAGTLVRKPFWQPDAVWLSHFRRPFSPSGGLPWAALGSACIYVLHS